MGVYLKSKSKHKHSLLTLGLFQIEGLKLKSDDDYNN